VVLALMFEPVTVLELFSVDILSMFFSRLPVVSAARRLTFPLNFVGLPSFFL